MRVIIELIALLLAVSCAAVDKICAIKKREIKSETESFGQVENIINTNDYNQVYTFCF